MQYLMVPWTVEFLRAKQLPVPCLWAEECKDVRDARIEADYGLHVRTCKDSIMYSMCEVEMAISYSIKLGSLVLGDDHLSLDWLASIATHFWLTMSLVQL